MLENYKKVGTIYDNKHNNSKIFEVKEKDGEEHYAVKLIGPLDDSLKNTIFTREINALKKLNKYKNIVTLYHNEVGTNKKDNKKYGILLLELVNGESLDKIEIENLDDIEKYKISIGIIEAVLNAHNNSIIHRDIKPSNVMVDGTNVKIIDFGISKIKSCIDEGTVKDFKSKDYCAPEVALRGESSELSDIYSIGAVIYYLFTGNKPPQPQHFEDKINILGLRGDFKELLVSMIKEIPEERESNLEKLKNSIEEIIKKVDSVVNKYYFNIDTELFELSKRKLIIKRSMNFNEFTKSILPNDFKTTFGLINNNDQYEFIGEKYIIKCIYEKNIFYIFELNTLLDDEKIRFKKRASDVIGKLFFDSSSRTDNCNDKLDILLDNYREEYNSNARKNNLFYDYFKTWRSYLIDSIEHEKVSGIRFSYSRFKIDGNKLTLEINEFSNKSVDDIKENTQLLIQQSVGEKELITRIGTYDSCEYSKGKTYINININKKESITKIKNLLNLKLLIQEDYLYKIISYQRQLAAINVLQEDNYECKNLKDIILDIKEPRRISELKNVNFKSELMNEYQKSSIYKFMASENIALIQGPPGTGKTTVINEVIYQILNENVDSNERPKILVVSQSHPAVDNILEGLIKKDFNLKIFRVGDEKNISEEISSKFTVDILKKNFINNIENNCRDYSEKLSEINLELEENSRLKNILNIQKEWIERLSSSDDIEYQIISNAEIVAGTCIGFIANPIIKEMLFDYVIIDEAAKATTPELLVSIIKAKKILLVGDHKQLPPYIESSKFDWTDNKTIKELRTSLFTNLYGILPDTHKEMLKRQYRMHPNIGDLISKTFYDGGVAAGVSAKDKQHKINELEGYSIVWYNTSNMGKIRKHKKTSGKSFYNVCEAEIIKEFIKRHTEIILEENINVGIITGYSAQKDLIRRKIKNYNLSNQIDVNTVDAFQGREDDIIIYSPVRSSDEDYRIGFQKEAERINVAFSRAKVLLIIVGDIDMYSRWREEENKFPEIVSYIRENPSECLIIDCSKEKTYAKLFREFSKNSSGRK
ncbi:serine/threonine protein kinase [Clostridium sp. DL-VIII]|uniref:AAA domain-containing protein n=1 Tax=Clostridium sp. DL-VIII TaxID=641107 RepID=UPI00023AF0A3|nr:AAA domain-containing protein [Clostridium sp. DL-VIII]EHI98159.1 serine/threonine protein kinase [Clostridium sp. DL-VIII]